ncbi:MAG: tetratricopeptide repeat protein [Terracidiphilus sp.]|nr:tetratricopeptide repeat protein [Terracidiphilus sp.]
MRGFQESRRLGWIAVVALLASGASNSLAQSFDPGASSDAMPAATAAEAAQRSAEGPAGKVTPENVGDALMLHQRYQAAIEAYQQAGEESSAVWNKMGIANQLMFNLQQASRCYQTSLKLDPNNPHVLNNLGTVYDSQNRHGDAARMYRRAIRMAPGSALIYRNLGTSLLAQHNFQKGWAAYQTALSLDPQIFMDRASPKVDNNGSAGQRGAMNYYMARGCVRAGMNDCAIDYLRRALNEGFTCRKKIAADSEFAGLRGDPAFEQLLAAQGQQ